MMSPRESANTDKKILFFDIDGTLIDDNKDAVPTSAVEALRTAREKGNIVYICSGRCLAIIPEFVKKIGFDGMVAGCGTYVEMDDKPVYHNVLSRELQDSVIEDLYKYHIDGVLEGKDCSAFREDPWMDEVLRIYSENSTFKAKTQCVWSEEFDFDKMALWHDESSDMESFMEKYSEYFSFIERDPTFYEAVPKGISKGTGIEFVCEKLGMPIENSVGFGDSTNDLPMLDTVGFSVAMGSGNPVLFNKVDYVTDRVENDGIKKALEYLKVI
ncbi:Cof-type HAD-IIB family hydrolase [Eubacterium xylanophilum]|uniref:Cof-type HAD-IIB family hydrolase n=1 Tax=Eubacterium xylanophilum TaxID=39497 RepID=UPI000684BB98|nr:Cof-type HAD-IIB family hydrolase [Eubacterium xylanophilum]